MGTRFRTPILLFALALAVRLVLLVLHPDPAYPDAFYYVNVARELAAGNGFNVDFIWIFAEVGGKIPAEPVLPIPSNAHWMPLASIVQVPFLWLLGETAVASALPFAIAGATAAPLTWALARDAGARETVAASAGLLVALPLLVTPFMAQPDNFSLFQPLVAGALWLTARGLKGDPRAFAIAGLLAGLATLARNDGILVAATIALAFAWDRLRRRQDAGETPVIPGWAAGAAAGFYLLAVVPWLLRQLAVFGQLSPSTASGKVLFLRNIDEWNSITTPANLDWLLGQGLGPLIASRIDGLIAAVSIYTILALGGLLLPFLVIGAWRHRRSPDFGPFFAYAAILFAFSSLVSAVHVPGGTFIHSAVALIPHSYVLALEGVLAAVAWLAARRPSWNAAQAGRIFLAATVVFATIAAAYGTLTIHGRWADARTDRLQVAAQLEAEGVGPDERLMSIDAAGYRYFTGRGGVVLVNDPLATIEEVARAYDVRWLILERDSAVPAVGPILEGDWPEWIGPPVMALRDPLAGRLTPPDLAVYPVCFSPDIRCLGETPEIRR